MAIFVKLPPNSGHLLITDKFFNTRRCPLFRGFTVVDNGGEFETQNFETFCDNLDIKIKTTAASSIY